MSKELIRHLPSLVEVGIIGPRVKRRQADIPRVPPSASIEPRYISFIGKWHFLNVILALKRERNNINIIIMQN